jgi:hypothetical protein
VFLLCGDHLICANFCCNRRAGIAAPKIENLGYSNVKKDDELMKNTTFPRTLQLFGVSALALTLVLITSETTHADVTDDTYENNIFTLYGTNGNITAQRVTLKDSIQNGQPSFIVIYVNDSRDCKKQAYEITQLQSRFGKAINFIAVNADAFPDDQPDLQKYYAGDVPRMLLFDGKGKLVYETTGYTTAKNMAQPFFDLEKILPKRAPSRAPMETAPSQ